ncbi:uncharacterized protein PG986_011134 [Apiospora aurea]|uniref:Uncharacterized protein n=1 Tax=Apiospora aurea TaxID=335848 RepID=A0ABR1Q474_9PEZI
MEDQPTPPYRYAYGDLVSELMPEQPFYNFSGEDIFDGSMVDTQGYQHGYPQQEYLHSNMMDPTGVKSDSALDLGFGDFLYNNNYGELPDVPSPAPTVPSSGITAPGTPLGVAGDFNSPQPQAIGPRLSQCSGAVHRCAHLY